MDLLHTFLSVTAWEWIVYYLRRLRLRLLNDGRIDEVNSFVKFHWEDPEIVGELYTFTVHLRTITQQPYRPKSIHEIVIQIENESLQIRPNIEMVDIENETVIRVQFRARKSGNYKILIKSNNQQRIANSPYTKRFVASEISPLNCELINFNFNTLLAQENHEFQLKVKLRDLYDNEIENQRLILNQLDLFDVRLFDLNRNRSIDVIELNSIITFVFCSPLGEHDVLLVFSFFRRGCYNMQIVYDNVEIPKAKFDVIVHDDDLPPIIDARHQKSFYENYIVEQRANESVVIERKRMKKVTVKISKHKIDIYVQLLWGFSAPFPFVSFRLGDSLKFRLHMKSNIAPEIAASSSFAQRSFDLIEIDDCLQTPVLLYTNERNLIIDTCNKFVAKQARQSLTFEQKKDTFYAELRQHHKVNFRRSFMLNIKRSDLVQSSFQECYRGSNSDWLKEFMVKFEGEIGVDSGGLKKDWIEQLTKKLFEPQETGLFCGLSSNDSQTLVLPNSHRLTKYPIAYYEFAGKIVGKCLHDNSLQNEFQCLVAARFTRSFLAQIIGHRVNYKHLRTDDPELYRSKVMYVLETNFDDDENSVEMTFSETRRSRTAQCGAEEVDLIPNGWNIRVTNDNKMRYLDALAQFKLRNSIIKEVHAFKKGFSSLVPEHLLSHFSENEFEMLICGSKKYSIDDLRQHHVIDVCAYVISAARQTQIVNWLWIILDGFSHEEMAQFLQFVTGSSMVPVGGFKDLRPQFKIIFLYPTIDALPTAHTCFNSLILTDYSSFEEFERMLRLSVREGTNYFGIA